MDVKTKTALGGGERGSSTPRKPSGGTEAGIKLTPRCPILPQEEISLLFSFLPCFVLVCLRQGLTVWQSSCINFPNSWGCRYMYDGTCFFVFNSQECMLIHTRDRGTERDRDTSCHAMILLPALQLVRTLGTHPACFGGTRPGIWICRQLHSFQHCCSIPLTVSPRLATACPFWVGWKSNLGLPCDLSLSTPQGISNSFKDSPPLFPLRLS